MTSQPSAPTRDRSWTTRVVVAAIVTLCLAIFIAENFVTVEVRLFVARTETRLAWALLVAAALGFVAGWSFSRIRR